MNRLLHRGCELALHTFDRRWQKLRTPDDELARQREHQPEGTVSVLVPVWNTRPEWLAALADSLHRQTLAGWECILYDGGSDRPATLRALEGLPGFDERLRVVHAAKNLGIAGNTNAALELARGGWIAFCDHDDVLEPDALWRMVTALNESGADTAYSDEDRITANGRTHYAPHFKPDWCPENLLACNYVCHLTVMKRELAVRLGGLREGLDGSQDHDLLLRCAASGVSVTHVPRILYHWRSNSGSMSHIQRDRCLETGCRAVEEHLRSVGVQARVAQDAGRLRVIRPWPQEAQVLVLFRAMPPDWLAALLMNERPGSVRWDMVPPQGPDELIRDADEELILLWDTALMPTDGLMTELAAQAFRPDVGCAFPQVLDRRGRIISSGYAISQDGTIQARGRGLKPDDCDPLLLEHSVHQVSCGDMGCVMFRRQLWQDGADSDGIGWMLRLAEQGLRHVVSPYAAALCEHRPMPAPVRPGLRDGCIIGRMPDER